MLLSSHILSEVEALCDRVNTRNGYRHRDFDTRVGTLDVAIPKLRSRTYFPDWLLERRRRAEAALTSMVAYSGCPHSKGKTHPHPASGYRSPRSVVCWPASP